MRALSLLVALCCLSGRAHGDDPLRFSLDRGLSFLVSDARKWREDHKCATCHHGALTVVALNEARNRGLFQDVATRDEMLQWSKERFVPPLDEPPPASAG